jgi:hypothetical protein
MTNEQAAQERQRISEEDRARAEKERNTTSQERIAEEAARNAERKQQRKDAISALESGNINIQEVAKQGGSLGRRLERELRRFEQTGRVTNWLAGETLKAETEQKAAQQAAFRQAVTDVVSTPLAPIQLGATVPSFSLAEKPELKGVGSLIQKQAWDLIARVDPEADPDNPNPPYLVSVVAGTLNNILPSNWEIEERLQSDGTLYYAKAVVLTDGQGITSVSIDIDSSPPIPQEISEFSISSPVEILFGLFSKGVVYRTIANGSINILPRQWLVLPANPPAAAGEAPYDIYYLLS